MRIFSYFLAQIDYITVLYILPTPDSAQFQMFICGQCSSYMWYRYVSGTRIPYGSILWSTSNLSVAVFIPEPTRRVFCALLLKGMQMSMPFFWFSYFIVEYGYFSRVLRIMDHNTTNTCCTVQVHTVINAHNYRLYSTSMVFGTCSRLVFEDSRTVKPYRTVQTLVGY